MDYFIIFKSVRCVLIMTYMYVYQLYIVCGCVMKMTYVNVSSI